MVGLILTTRIGDGNPMTANSQGKRNHLLFSKHIFKCRSLLEHTPEKLIGNEGESEAVYTYGMWVVSSRVFSFLSVFRFEFRFDPLKLMQILRGKRLMFVGDSVQRGQFESMVCMVQSIIPQGKKSLQRVPPRKIFRIDVKAHLVTFSFLVFGKTI